MTSSERTRKSMADVLSGKHRSPFSRFLFVGPAVIASIAYMDPGNYATNIQAGAGYGYQLLWVVLMANLIAMLFQALSARLGIVTGKNLAELSRDQFSHARCVGNVGGQRSRCHGHGPCRVSRRCYRAFAAFRFAPDLGYGRDGDRYLWDLDFRALRLSHDGAYHRHDGRNHRAQLSCRAF